MCRYRGASDFWSQRECPMGGHYAEEYGTPICMQCPRGQYQDEKGQRGSKSFEHFDHGKWVLRVHHPENRSASWNLRVIYRWILYVQLSSRVRQGGCEEVFSHALTVSVRIMGARLGDIFGDLLYADLIQERETDRFGPKILPDWRLHLCSCPGIAAPLLCHFLSCFV